MMNHKTLMLVEIAILTTLAFLLDTIPGLQFTIWPQGGSVSFAMIPVFIIAFRWGLKAGLASGLIFGVLDLLFGGTVVHWLQGLLDYIVAFVGLGVAGVFASGIRKGLSNNDHTKVSMLIILGTFIGMAIRFIAHYLAGVIFFAHFAPEDQPVWLYSLVYNSTYLIPGFILSAIIIIMLVISRPQLVVRTS
ncbi:energy-coupled thiamine transporter ThiT [Allobacillus sp. SKP2-8]|uniref:Energy-coupled thiamine transporter ThiT n=2 Tax=Bacillaceae TaxID=186817 RepID=A0ABS6GQ45_9BACI|nr:energy-coupled thiamine transporter ThiT [Allobacillus halotolerans]TSJ69502.1 energy-coupled thiamine transporter ThiT [Allobacillus sp. SKP2-8]